MRWCHDGFFIFQTWIIWTLSQVTSDRKRTPLRSRGREGEDGRSLGLDEQKWKWNQCLECLKGSLNTRSCWQKEPRGRSCRLSEAGENFNTAFSKKQNWVTWGAGGLGGWGGVCHSATLIIAVFRICLLLWLLDSFIVRKTWFTTRLSQQ